eukprot:9496772-Pyramimonas_sp.AAC.2
MSCTTAPLLRFLTARRAWCFPPGGRARAVRLTDWSCAAERALHTAGDPRQQDGPRRRGHGAACLLSRRTIVETRCVQRCDEEKAEFVRDVASLTDLMRTISDFPEEEEELDLMYDPILNFYYDPKSNKYYELL